MPSSTAAAAEEREYQEMLADVAGHFSSPAAIVAATNLRRNQRIALLKRWAEELEQLIDESGRTAGNGAESAAMRRLRDVHKAMATLGIRPGWRKAQAQQILRLPRPQSLSAMRPSRLRSAMTICPCACRTSPS